MRKYRIVERKYNDGVITFTPQFADLDKQDKHLSVVDAHKWNNIELPELVKNTVVNRGVGALDTEGHARLAIDLHEKQHPYIIEEKEVKID